MTGHWEVTSDRIDGSHHVSIGEGAFGMIYEGRVKVFPKTAVYTEREGGGRKNPTHKEGTRGRESLERNAE
jgi:hypothetical protein